VKIDKEVFKQAIKEALFECRDEGDMIRVGNFEVSDAASYMAAFIVGYMDWELEETL